MSPGEVVSVLIASPLEGEHVDSIAAVDPRVRVLYAPELLARQRYAGDHSGDERVLSPEEGRRWRRMLGEADVSFDFNRRDPGGVMANSPRLRWIQATSAGVGDYLTRFPVDFARVTVTTAAGVHKVPLTEFALAGLLHFTKSVPTLRSWQAERRWQRYTTRLLAGQRVMIVGLGHIGRHLAATLDLLDVSVLGVVRSVPPSPPRGVDRLVTTSEIDAELPYVDAVVLACPLTEETRGLLSADRLAALPAGAVVVNIGRGQVIDEGALVRHLADGHLGGAFLDVTAVEPLPPDSPLWDMPNVVISPHSASTVDSENRLITDLFRENLTRWLNGRPLINVYRPERGY